MKKIDKNILKNITGLNSDTDFECKQCGLSNTDIKDTLSFIDSDKYLSELNSNDNITVVITNHNLASRIKNKTIVLCDDPRYYYYTLYNYIARHNYKKQDSTIADSAQIHPKSFIAEYNVKIGENTIIEPNVTILSDVEIGNNCVIGANSVLGCDDAEIKVTSKRFLKVFHDGKLIIGNNVEIGANCTIDKGFLNKPTIIGDNTKIANTSLVGHCSEIGKNCLILCCIICGSTKIGNSVRINPGATISNTISIGDFAQISIGAVVVENVEPYGRVTGNFAINHNTFLKRFSKIKYHGR